MVQSIRAALDELMGEDRNGDAKKPELPFYHPDVCKPFLQFVLIFLFIVF
jgi:hypothetical protein